MIERTQAVTTYPTNQTKRERGNDQDIGFFSIPPVRALLRYDLILSAEVVIVDSSSRSRSRSRSDFNERLNERRYLQPHRQGLGEREQRRNQTQQGRYPELPVQLRHLQPQLQEGREQRRNQIQQRTDQRLHFSVRFAVRRETERYARGVHELDLQIQRSQQAIQQRLQQSNFPQQEFRTAMEIMERHAEFLQPVMERGFQPQMFRRYVQQHAPQAVQNEITRAVDTLERYQQQQNAPEHHSPFRLPPP